MTTRRSAITHKLARQSEFSWMDSKKLPTTIPNTEKSFSDIVDLLIDAEINWNETGKIYRNWFMDDSGVGFLSFFQGWGSFCSYKLLHSTKQFSIFLPS